MPTLSKFDRKKTRSRTNWRLLEPFIELWLFKEFKKTFDDSRGGGLRRMCLMKVAMDWEKKANSEREP